MTPDQKARDEEAYETARWKLLRPNIVQSENEPPEHSMTEHFFYEGVAHARSEREQEIVDYREALEYYANDPAYDESKYIMISSNFRSNNAAREVLSKWGKE